MGNNHLEAVHEKRKQSGRAEFRQQIIEQCGSVCVNCGSDRDVEYHHIVPLSNGGSIRAGNVVALCSICHLKAHGKLKYRNVWSRDKEIALKKPDGADADIANFLQGAMSKGDICRKWGLGQETTLHRIDFFRKYLVQHNIVSYKNFVELRKNHRANAANNDEESNYLASVVICGDGTEERYYRTMKNGQIISVEKEVLKGEVDE